MDDCVTQTQAQLYERDFYAWTQAQAELLRDGRLDQADIANILEEIESLGRKEAAELRSRLKVLTQHLLKEIYQPERASRSWAATIVHQRDELESHLQDNPSLESKLVDSFRRAYSSARKVAAAETGLPLKAFPVEAPFSPERALDPSFWPGRAMADRS